MGTTKIDPYLNRYVVNTTDGRKGRVHFVSRDRGVDFLHVSVRSFLGAEKQLGFTLADLTHPLGSWRLMPVDAG